MHTMMSWAKFFWRAALPEPARARVSKAREWGRVLLNYALMRSMLANRLHPFGAWPNALFIEVTNICNARCVFCAYGQTTRAKAVMPMELFRDAVTQFLDAARGPVEIDLTPIVGEPFVDGHLFERLDFLNAQPRVRRFHFYTNAILMKPEYAQRLASYGERLWIFCSLGGFDPRTYLNIMGVDKFHEAAANIKHLAETKQRLASKLHLQINIRAPRGNAKGELWDHLCRLRDAGIVLIDANEDFDNWGGKITAEDLKKAGLTPKEVRARRGPCHRLITGPAVLADGRVNACTCRDCEATLIIGDLRQERLADILSGPKLKDLLARHERGDFPGVCVKCTWYDSLYPGWMRSRGWRVFQGLFGGYASPKASGREE